MKYRILGRNAAIVRKCCNIGQKFHISWIMTSSSLELFPSPGNDTFGKLGQAQQEVHRENSQERSTALP
jgi:hypothetical protein